jgi:hypothetical protein
MKPYGDILVVLKASHISMAKRILSPSLLLLKGNISIYKS